MHSDIDVLIIPRGDESSLFETIKKIDKQINPLFVNLRTFKSYIRDKTPLYNNLKKDSVIIFAKRKIQANIKEFLQEVGNYNGSRI